MSPEVILSSLISKAENYKGGSIQNPTTIEDIRFIALCSSNRAGVRLLMSCMLAKIHQPHVDPRNPYTEIPGGLSFSGRTYDEKYLTRFINDNRLPVNPTTAFLTPTLRNIAVPLTTDRELVGRPRELYTKTLAVLEQVALDRVSAESVFLETIKVLIDLRDEKLARMASLINALQRGEGALPLSSEAIVTLISQHLSCKNSSRLPVLIVAAAYQSVGVSLGEKLLPLNGHNAADLQTGSLGDVEVCLASDNSVVTAYEMKMKKVTHEDIDHAVTKIMRSEFKIHNYLFVTTDIVDPLASEYALGFYEKLDGTELAILDCVDFLRHFLHLFHRCRGVYLQAYQSLVLSEPDSAVSQTLKEAFLALRQAAESGE